MALNIPNQMKLSQYMFDCCICLQREQKFSVDTTLPHMIRLGQLGDRIYTALGSVSRENSDADNIGVRMHLQSLQSQLKELENQGRLAANKSGKRIFE